MAKITNPQDTMILWFSWQYYPILSLPPYLNIPATLLSPPHFYLLCLLGSIWITWFSWVLSSKSVSPPDTLGFYAHVKTTIFSFKYLLEFSMAMYPAHRARMPERLFARFSGWPQKLGHKWSTCLHVPNTGTVPRFLWEVHQLLHSNARANACAVFTYEKSNSG